MEHSYFVLPADGRSVARITDAVPPTWNHIYGTLTAPWELYNKGQVAEFTRVQIKRYHYSPEIVGSDDVPFGDIDEQSAGPTRQAKPRVPTRD